MARRIILGVASIWGLAVFCGVGADTLFVAGADGVYAFEFEPETGRLGPAMLAAKMESPSCLAAHPAGWFLLTACNTGEGAPGGGLLVSSFVDPNTGTLTETGRVETGGTSAADVEVDARRGAAFVANDGGGTVAGFPLGMDGSLGARAIWIEHEGSSVVLPRQARPQPQEVRVSPDGRHVYVPDLGTDEVFIYEFGEDGVLRPAPVRTAKTGEGAGPRRLDFHPSLPALYLVTEMSSRVTLFRRDPGDGSLTALQSMATVPEAFLRKNTGAAIGVHPGGGFLYASNCGHDSIAVYRVDEQGFLAPVEYRSSGGKTPLHFAIHPSGKWLVAGNRDSGNLVVFSIDSKTGKLDPAGEPVAVWAPVNLVFAPAP